MVAAKQIHLEKTPVLPKQSERAPKYISRERLIQLDKEVSEQYDSVLKKLAE